MTQTQIGRLRWASVVVFKSLLVRSLLLKRIQMIYSHVITGNCGADLLMYVKYIVVKTQIKTI